MMRLKKVRDRRHEAIAMVMDMVMAMTMMGPARGCNLDGPNEYTGT